MSYWNQSPQIGPIANFGAKIRNLQFRAKVGYFYTRILKNYGHIWNQIFLSNSKIWCNKKLFNLRLKMLFLDWNLKIILSHLKSALNLSNWKVWCKIKILKFGTKNVLFWYWWVWNLKRFGFKIKKFAIIEIITLKFV